MEAASQLQSRFGHVDGGTILLVEDDHSAREALHEILNHAGYSVLPAENGKRALESVEATGAWPRLILLDLAMPVMDGVTFLSEVPRYAKLARVPVIVMSGDSKASRLRSERAGNVMEVLAKPVDLSRMMELVKRHAVGHHHVPSDGR
ncbi:MAG: response regulator [Deltaproteobacteria bacterium]|nr:response regulator [Deltaproteobacteria bacterium]